MGDTSPPHHHRYREMWIIAAFWRRRLARGLQLCPRHQSAGARDTVPDSLLELLLSLGKRHAR